MGTALDHFKSLPRIQLQRELRKITGIEKFYLWEFMGLGWIFLEVYADHRLADQLGVTTGAVIGYRVLVGHVTGGAMSDLMNVESDEPRHPDPFR
ncbi:MAG TPA: hypothetical protein VMQ56_17555 [Terracidiphilus sp.]|jgi:hypothetical protein|nr:hypothetical protein [Terracidiphilus sp.]